MSKWITKSVTVSLRLIVCRSREWLKENHPNLRTQPNLMVVHQKFIPYHHPFLEYSEVLYPMIPPCVSRPMYLVWICRFQKSALQLSSSQPDHGNKGVPGDLILALILPELLRIQAATHALQTCSDCVTLCRFNSTILVSYTTTATIWTTAWNYNLHPLNHRVIQTWLILVLLEIILTSKSPVTHEQVIIMVAGASSSSSSPPKHI